ncbi:SNARE-associated domain-containing protein [Mobilicoccus massiliensis]|uniref:hypothetical protein n=1 Tax=Mobilicoccus massiliensis TaxID=1522310 RepID=UPI00069351FE|nr:hypothetical protein [Mobilicoccus massiliensis]
MPEMFAGWPLWAFFAFLFALAMLRGQAIYWLARYLTSAGLRNAPEHGWRHRFATWLDGSGVNQGAAMLRRLGLVAVPLCYVTVGLQSAVLAAAGVLRIGAPRFALAQVPGALAWATIYSTIGWALWEATIMAVAGSPWGIAGFAAIVVAVVVATLLRRRARRRFDGTD